MGEELERSLEAGCIGMSAGLQYMPGLQSDTRELVRLGRILKKYDGIYTAHLRTYMKDLPKAVDETAIIARENDIRAQVSHLFWAPDIGPMSPVAHAFARMLIKLSKYWTAPLKIDGEIDRELRKLTRMRKKGVEIRADVMPSSTTFTHLVAYLPPWVLLGTRADVEERFTNPNIRRKIRRDIEEGSMTWPHTGRSAWSLNVLKLLGWESTIIMSVVTPENKHLEGKTIGEIGRIRNCHPFDAMMDLLVEEEARVLIFSALGEPDDTFTEQSVYAGMADPEAPISTDSILMGIGTPSNLFHGAFPKFFARYVREKKMMDLETAVRKCTAVPADHFGLKQRGTVKEGWFADLVVFDPGTIAPNCDFSHPAGVPSGIDHVFINGSHVVGNGGLTNGKLPGKMLRR
jgi:N-acyl-D-amino-acid deacylase